MGNFTAKLAKKVSNKAGTSFWKTFILTSSNILLSAATDLTGVATGDLIIEKAVVATDVTGLATGTNFEISVSGETYGLNKPLVEAVSNLGANVIRIAPHPAVSGDTTNDYHMTVTAAVPFVLQAGDKLQYGSSGADCTGAGKILVAIKFTRVADNADIESAV